jgi:hypothetical protein
MQKHGAHNLPQRGVSQIILPDKSGGRLSVHFVRLGHLVISLPSIPSTFWGSTTPQRPNVLAGVLKIWLAESLFEMRS